MSPFLVSQVSRVPLCSDSRVLSLPTPLALPRAATPTPQSVLRRQRGDLLRASLRSCHPLPNLPQWPIQHWPVRPHRPQPAWHLPPSSVPRAPATLALLSQRGRCLPLEEGSPGCPLPGFQPSALPSPGGSLKSPGDLLVQGAPICPLRGLLEPPCSALSVHARRLLAGAAAPAQFLLIWQTIDLILIHAHQTAIVLAVVIFYEVSAPG